jgi:NTP pyrophosphatase (non-canonical NTP hydrolase)|tara:strand:+ start:765 stop:1022 length:258 start_codon:yes stop_codon:yes gene_type:complete
MTVQERIELLAIMAEECGELTQECMKIVRFGKDTEAMKNLTKEVGDVVCMIKLLEEKGLVNYDDVETRVKEKREKLKTFSSLTNL